ncbi:hypothetical protein PVAND_003162 [Polypedilum vanderplanki]|uniref:Odorant receptor n=1 Tax=Polypedilum vanderplanki TaxID=319348 RepID=A0A9J6BT80_POLVA|nr:hypothetical protein PVAND_003162 [Polypedilum vanderplanki]
MKLSERLRIFATRIKSYFVSDQVRNFVLFLEDFFPSEKCFKLLGFFFFNELQTSMTQTQQQRRKIIFWAAIIIKLVILFLHMINFLIVAGKLKNFVASTETFGFINGYILIMVKIFIFCYWKRKGIMKIIERLDKYFPHSSHDQMQFKVPKHKHHLKILHQMSFAAHALTWSHTCYIPLLSIMLGYEMQLIGPIYFPIDPFQYWLYPIIYIIEAWDLFFFYFMLFAMDAFFCSLVCVTSMEFDVLAQKLGQIDPETDENADKKLGEIIDGYNELTDIANELEDIFSPLLLAHVFGVIFMLCAGVFLLFVTIFESG